MAKMKSFSEYLNPTPEVIVEDVMKPSLGKASSTTEQSNFMESFSKNYEAFTQNVEKAEQFIEKFNELAESVKPNENLIERGEVESILATHLLIINQNIQEIKKDLLGINESDLSKITDVISSIDARTETLIEFVQAELPKNKNKLYELSLNLDKKVALISAEISDVEETTAATFESVSRKLAEAEASTEEQFKLSDEVKVKILAKVNELYEDVHSTNVSISTLSENYDAVLLPAIERINAFEENLTSVDSVVQEYHSSLDKTKEELKQVINEVNTIFINEKYVELDRKVQRIEEIFESVTSAKPLNEEATILTPEELKSKTAEEVEKYLSGKSFQQPNPDAVSTSPEFKNIANKLKFLEQAIGRIAATGPGGGEVNLRYLDDVDRSSIQDGRFLKYDAATKKFVFSAIDLSALNYQGVWDALANSPALVTGTGTKGYYYIVGTAGTTALDGISDWKIGDWVVFSGTEWQKIDNTDSVTSVNGQTGPVVLGTMSDQNANAVAITGGSITVKDNVFTLQDNVDPFKQAQFQLSGLLTAQTTVYTLPVGFSAASLLLDAPSTQTINGIKTFSSATQNVGSSVNASTQQFAYGATTTGNTKTVNLGTGGLSGSTTAITVGSANGSTTTMLGSTTIGGVAGNQSLQVNSVASSVNYWNMNGAAAGGTITMGAAGIDGNIPFAITSKGTSAGLLYTNGFNALQAVIFHTDSAVNYVGLTGAGTNAAPTISSAGSDANIGLNYATKGTGSHNFLTNSTTKVVIDSIGRLGIGTTVPSAALDISSSLVAGTFASQIFSATNNVAAKTNYVKIDAAVAFNSAGSEAGAYTIQVLQNNAYKTIMTAAGTVVNSTNYLAFGTTNEAIRIVSNGTTSIGGTPGVESLRVTPVTNAVNYVNTAGAGTNAAPTISSAGSDANVGLTLSMKGWSSIQFYSTTGGQLFQIGQSTSTTANFFQVLGNSTGNAPIFSAQGIDTNVGLNLTSKGFGIVNVNTGTGTVAKFQDRGVTTVNSPFIFRAGLSGTTAGVLTFPVSPMLQSPDPSDFTFNTNAGTVGGQSGSTQVVLGHTASAVNYLRLTGSGTNGGIVANAAPSISVLGSDTNINLVLTPKGTGSVVAGGSSAFSTSGGMYIGSGASPHYMYSASATSLGFRVGTSPSYFQFTDDAGAIGLSTGNPFYFKGWAGTYTFGIAGPVNAQAVNYLTVGTSVTGAGPTLYPNGSDTNISLSLQPKGSGAINFVTGSQVNLSLGNSVSGIKIGQSGVGYTSFPTVVIAAPNAPSGGTQAVAAAINSMKNVTATIVSGGTGYAVGNLLTIVGGVIQISAGTMTVTSVSAGVITGVSIVNFAPYGAPLQANPVTTTVTPAGGSGATFNIGYGIYSGTVGITNAGSGYVEQPAISFTGGGTPTTVATGFATVGSIPIIDTLGSALSFYTPSGEQFRINDSNAPAVNYLQATGGATGISPGLSVQGTDAAIGFGFTTKGTGNTQFSSNQYVNVKLLLQAVNASVNYLNIRPSLTNFPITLNANGSDTNTGIAIISKGTGAIDLAAGSSGINISNGSTVTAIPITSIGSGLTSVPTVTISAPTTPGGVNAIATVTSLGIWGVGVNSGGTGYSVNDVLTFVGGTVATSAVTVKVTAVSGSTITAVSVLNYGSYSVLPSVTAAATTVVPAGGTGATLNSTWRVYGVGISNAGSGYVEQPTVTFSAAGGVAAIGYAQIGGVTTVKSLGTSMNMQTANGQTFLQVLDDTTLPSSTSGLYLVGASSGLGRVGLRSNKALYIGTQGGQPFGFFTNTTSTSDGSQQFAITNTNGSVNWVSVTGGGTNVWPTLSAAGSDENVGLFINTKGSAGVTFATSGATQTYIAHTASAVNYPQLTGGITGNAPTISSAGQNADINLSILAKNNGSVNISNGNGTAVKFYGGANNFAIAGAPSGSGPEISAQGSDANIDLKLTPKGTGVLNITATPTAAAGAASTHKIPVKINGVTYYILVSNV